MLKRRIILLLILPTLGLCCLVGFRIIFKGPVDTRSPQEIRFQAASNQMAAWNLNADFLTISNTGEFASHLKSALSLKTNVAITSQQTDLLQDAIHNFLMAFHDGDYSVYKKFRMVAAGGISPQHLKTLQTFLSKKSGEPLASLSALSQDELFRKFVELRSEGTIYKNFFSAVSFQKSQVEVGAYNAMPKDLKTFVLNNTTNLGLASYEPMFTFERSPEAILQQDRVLVCATAVLYVKTSESSGEDMPAPIYLRLAWDIQSKQWLPYELAVGNIWQKSKIVMAF